ncbi:MAG: DUF1854 domain-containing protein [Planctomycetes bacterium]|nr:DUF1854 domain-containing protein [Planctomycetota bacterium]
MHDTSTAPLLQRSLDGSPHDLEMLHPESVTIYRPDSGFPNLILKGEVCYPRVRIVRCFPLSAGSVYVSIHDWADREIGVIEDPSLLDEESRRTVAEELDKRYFVSEINDIYTVENRHGYAIFDVQTNRGRRVFNVHDRRRNIVQLGREQVFVIDTDGCQYNIPDYRTLSIYAQRQLYKIL